MFQRKSNSSIQTTTRFLMLKEVKMLKDNKLSHGTGTERLTRDGELSIQIKLRRCKKRDFMKTSVSILTDHSTSDQDFQCKEFWKCMVTPMSISEDG
jgi:hypothetical protein